jgi:hypothetical protein
MEGLYKRREKQGKKRPAGSHFVVIRNDGLAALGRCRTTIAIRPGGARVECLGRGGLVARVRAREAHITSEAGDFGGGDHARIYSRVLELS